MFREFYLGMKDPKARASFAAKAGTTARYIEAHLLSPDPLKRKKPRTELLRGFVDASSGKLSYEGLANYFYIEQAVAGEGGEAA